MKSRPILFSAPMVRALLAWTKTQTRRVAKPVRHPDFGNLYKPGALVTERELQHIIERACPHGQPGDQLWVRETWRIVGDSPTDTLDMFDRDDVQYRADDDQSYVDKYRPSIHMPRRFSRITLEITRVRVERLGDISEADAKAEGCERLHDDEPGYVFREDPDWNVCPKCGGTGLHTALGAGGGVIFDVDCTECDTYAKRYRHLWESINGPQSWDLNPWVWVIEFRRLP